MHRLDRPAAFDQPRSEPVEQLRVAGLLTHGAEVIGRPDDALAEMMLPEAVDEHPRQQADRPPVSTIRRASSSRPLLAFRG